MLKPNKKTGEVPVAEFASGDIPALTQALFSGLGEIYSAVAALYAD